MSEVPQPPPPKPLPAAALDATSVQQANRPRADLIVVDKTERRLQLFFEGSEIASYPIQLGKEPEGHKQREGDNRTPEGRYHIDWRNPESAYFRSLRISYPNELDRAQAETAGVDPGNMIMIHGMPNDVAYRREVWDEPNWTNGCIALRDHHMIEVWDLVEVGTPIEILP